MSQSDPEFVLTLVCPDTRGIVFAGVVLCVAVVFIQRGQAVFLYFNF